MGVLLNRRRYMGASKQAKTLFEMYNQYFDGTVNSVVDTGLKLWDGTHNRWKMEVEYDAITAQYANNITLFTVRPDASPYSGVRVRKDRAFRTNSDFTLTVGEACTIISNPGEFSFGTNSYGSHLYIGNTNSVNSFTLIRDGQYLYCDYNGQTATLKITDPLTNNLNLLIGCDYKGANNETQRYYTGTVQKFVIKELPSADEVIMTSITNPEVLAVCYAQGWCADANYMTKSEAEAVTNNQFATTFYQNTSITHFEEFQYFTGVTSLSQRAFQSCTNLKTIVLPPDIVTINSSCFRDDSNLESVTGGGGITRFNSEAFKGCAKLASWTFDNALTNIGNSAFNGCSVINFTNDLPSTVTTLGVSTFASTGFTGHLTIPNNITSIPQRLFQYAKITSVTLPSTCTDIGNFTFYGANQMQSLTVLATTPPTIGGTNTFTQMTGTIYVPAVSVETYKTASGWSGLASRIQAIPT